MWGLTYKARRHVLFCRNVIHEPTMCPMIHDPKEKRSATLLTDKWSGLFFYHRSRFWTSAKKRLNVWTCGAFFVLTGQGPSRSCLARRKLHAAARSWDGWPVSWWRSVGCHDNNSTCMNMWAAGRLGRRTIAWLRDRFQGGHLARSVREIFWSQHDLWRWWKKRKETSCSRDSASKTASFLSTILMATLVPLSLCKPSFTTAKEPL